MADTSLDNATSPVAPYAHRSEPQLRAAIVTALRTHGIGVEEDVLCDAGMADLVAAQQTVIIEVKHTLTRRALQHAIGQLLLYRVCLRPDARAIIVGYETPETAVLIPHVAALGVEVVCWRDPVKQAQDTELSEVLTRPAARPYVLRPTTLRWNIQALAVARDLSSVRELSFAVGKPRQSLYKVWYGESKTISLDMLAALSRGLDVEPGDWFRWAGTSLRWRVHEAARMRNLSIEDLVWRAEILPYSLAAIWNDKAKFVFLDTLGKLAQVLNLYIGDLFMWDTVITEIAD